MRRILLITAREYRRMTRLPAFWVISLLVPLIVLILPIVQGSLGKSQTVAYVLVDKSGRFENAINQRVELDYQREVLVQLLLYAQEWRAGDKTTAGSTPAGGPAAAGLGVSSDAMVQNFVAAGGAPAVLKLLKPKLFPDAPAFQPPARSLVEIPAPAGVDTSDPDKFGASIGPHFEEASKTFARQAGLGVAVYIPANIGSGGQVRVWTNGPAGASLLQDLRVELVQGLQREALARAKVDPLTAVQVQSVSAPIAIAPAIAATPGGQAIIHSVLPLALADLLLASMVTTGALMLQGLVEERSNKLLEAVLACVSPRELMVGKLLGISAIGLSIIAVWVAAAIGIVHFEPSHPLGFLIPALASIWQTPWVVLAMVFYFLAGYLMLGMVFLTVGAISDSMQEAQAYMMPLTLVLIAPAGLMTTVIYRDPNGLIPRIISWIPLYTPVTMLARLQTGVTTFEIVGTAVVLLAFIGLELLVLGRLFENNLIQTGGGFRLRLPFSLPPLNRRLAFAPLVLAVVAVVVVVRIEHRKHGGQDQTPTLQARGQSLFQTRCASCHEPAIGRAPSRDQLSKRTPEEIVAALTFGVMKPMSAGLNDADLRALATYLTGHQPGPGPVAGADPPRCASPGSFSIAGPGWNGWSIDPRNSRFQANPGLSATDAPRLKVKWAFSYPGGKYGQPTVVGGRLFLTSIGGAVYSLDAKTGCMFWRFAQPAASRTTVSVGPLPGVAPSGYAAYFGDQSDNVYAADAGSGALLWKVKVESHPYAHLTGSPTLVDGRLYVPVSSSEEGVANLPQYACCTFRGSVVAALDGATGKQLWKAYAIEQAPAPAGKNPAGTQMYGPAGAAVWSAPTVDGKRKRLYFTTGNSYSDVAQSAADAIVAVDLTSGRIVWERQVTAEDNDLSGCEPSRPLPNCPKHIGDDFDFGAPPILVANPGGKDVLVAGQKSGVVYGINPDTGEILWRTQVGVGGFLGGIEWGMASDGERVYAANADIVVGQGGSGRPGLFALDPATGKDLWFTPAPRAGCSWSGTICFDGQSAAPTAAPGVIFAGTTDGHEHAYSAVDGRILWDFNTAGQTYQTINGVHDQAGGSIDVSSGVIADGMLFVVSGYRGVLGGGADNVLLAFSLDGR